MRIMSLIKNPILAMGILFSFIFLFQLKEKGYLSDRQKKLTPSSCRAVIVKLNRRLPSTWRTSCEGEGYNNLVIDIPYSITKQGNLQQTLYRELANFLILIAKNSPSDNLERTDLVTIYLESKLLKINALTRGKFLVKLSTLTDKKLIAQHLQGTVQIQEVKK